MEKEAALQQTATADSSYYFLRKGSNMLRMKGRFI